MYGFITFSYIEYVFTGTVVSNNIKFDEESVLRERMIKNVKDYLVERDALFNSTLQVANSNNIESTKKKKKKTCTPR